jgi:hypothetical protein
MALEAVQARTGHASIESTWIYLHLADDWLAAQYRKAAEVIYAQVFAGQPAACGSWRRAGRGAATGWANCRPAVNRRRAIPQTAATMRHYLTQNSCVLRPGSVGGADLALRCLAAFLAQAAPEVTAIAQVTRRHIEDYKPRLAARPRQNKPRLTPGTIIHRLGTLRMFFIRIDEWGWAEAPPGCRCSSATCHPLPKALDDASAARLLCAAQNDKRLLVRVTWRCCYAPPAGQRVHRPAGRRGRADRRRAVAARAGRHAPRGPLPAAAPAPGRADR